MSATLEQRTGTVTQPARTRSGTLPKFGVRQIAALIFFLGAALWVLPDSTPTYWIFITNAGVALAAAALGLMIVVGWSKEVSLAQAGLVGTACYSCGSLYRPNDGMGLPFGIAAILAIGIVIAISIVVSLATARLSGIYIMILTLAVQVTIEKIVFTTGMVDPPFATPRPDFLGINLSGDRAYYVFSVCLLAALVLFITRLRASRFGRALMLAGTDRQAASSVGVSPWASKIFAFALAGLCAGVAGVITSSLYSSPPSYIKFISLESLFMLAIPVLAGFRSVLGVCIVAVLFAVTPQALEEFRIDPFILGGVGLLAGTMTGAHGLSGLVLNQISAYKRRKAGKTLAVDVRDSAESLDITKDATTHAAAEASRRDAAYTQALRVLEDYLPEPAQDGDVLVADGISVAFGGLKAVSDVSITVPARKLVGLIGPNGAGKSTCFDLINGLRPPDAGHVFLFGENVTETRAWDRAALGLSRTFQASRVNLELSVKDNLLAGAYKMIPGSLIEAVVGLPRAREGERRALEASEAVAHLMGLSDYFDELVGNLDFGAQRRVEIGRSLMSGPRLLLLDEPAAGLDATEAHALFTLVRRLEQDLGLTVLLVEHYVKAVLDNCDIVYVLSQGEIIAAGTPDEIVADPQVRAVYLGESYQRDTANADA